MRQPCKKNFVELLSIFEPVRRIVEAVGVLGWIRRVRAVFKHHDALALAGKVLLAERGGFEPPKGC